MSPAQLKELQLQAQYPAGISARVDSPLLKRLLDERTKLLWALDALCTEIDEEQDIVDGRDGPKPNWAMRLSQNHGAQTSDALTFAKEPAP